MSKGEERCCKCDEPTGRAGKGDDSLYRDDDSGPYCEECYDKPTCPTCGSDNPERLAGQCWGDRMNDREPHYFHSQHDKPTGGLTDEQIEVNWSESWNVDRKGVPHVIAFAKRIEAIVRKDYEGHTMSPHGHDKPTTAFCVKCYKAGRDDTVNGTLMAIQAACKGAADRARKDERAKARQHIWVRKGVQRAECCRAALEDARVTLLDDDEPADAILRDDEPDDRDACDRGDA